MRHFSYKNGEMHAEGVALATIAIYERTNIVGHVQQVAPTFQSRLNALADHPLGGEARGVGLLGGLELVKDKHTRQSFDGKIGMGAKVVALAQNEGLIVRAVAGDTVAICPPLIITEEEVNTLFDRLEKALDGTYVWAKAEGHLG